MCYFSLHLLFEFVEQKKVKENLDLVHDAASSVFQPVTVSPAPSYVRILQASHFLLHHSELKSDPVQSPVWEFKPDTFSSGCTEVEMFKKKLHKASLHLQTS